MRDGDSRSWELRQILEKLKDAQKKVPDLGGSVFTRINGKPIRNVREAWLLAVEKAVKENPADIAFLEKYFNNISEYLTQPEDVLSMPAICMWNDEQRFEQFVEEGTKGSFIAVKPNLAYYKKNLPKSSPQFFTVVYKVSKDDAVFEVNIEAIKNAVDFATLKNMLGK